MFCSINRWLPLNSQKSIDYYRWVAVLGVLIDWRSVKKLLRKERQKLFLDRTHGERLMMMSRSVTWLFLIFYGASALVTDWVRFIEQHHLWFLLLLPIIGIRGMFVTEKKSLSLENVGCVVEVSNFAGSRSRLGSIELYSPDNRSITKQKMFWLHHIIFLLLFVVSLQKYFTWFMNGEFVSIIFKRLSASFNNESLMFSPRYTTETASL